MPNLVTIKKNRRSLTIMQADKICQEVRFWEAPAQAEII